MISLYRLLFLPALLILGPYYLLRMRKRGGYREHFSQRFGTVPSPQSSSTGKRVWIQAVSVGELLAIEPLLNELLKKDGLQIILTTTTSTGYAIAQQKWAPQGIIVSYFPMDFWPFSRKAWQRFQPDLCILMEGELWPEHMHQAQKRGIPILLLNARLSDRSLSRMNYFPRIGRWRYHFVDKVLAASSEDSDRIQSAGYPASQIEIAGNIKCDAEVSPRLNDSEKASLREELGFPSTSQHDGGPLILLGASTWPGEEAMLTQTYETLLQNDIPVRLLIVPRHMERREDIRKEYTGSKHRIHFRSEGKAGRETDICIADTTGELKKFMQLADIAFIGKSMPPHTEGQTPIEAGLLGIPMILGPGMSNFRSIAKSLIHNGIAEQANDQEALTKAILHLAETPSERDRRHHLGLAWQQQNRGALQTSLKAIEELIA